ncbi:MAG: hypothetical protein KC444_09665 [Nitrosopumilus sp.]|nr:hypothetical protein [Nitrosopumilus sp.]
MRRIFYIIIPTAAFALVLSNALFGEILFDSSYDQDINKYSVYVHLQQDWRNSGNILFDVTNVWSDQKSKSNRTYSSDEPSDITLLSNYNSNQLQYQHGKSFVELKHDFSNCDSSWKPISYRYIVDIIRSKIDLIQGTKMNDDPYVSVFPNSMNFNYDAKKQTEYAKQGYVQFIPICTDNETTSYEYSVSVNDKSIGFDVYFVPSEEEMTNYLKGDSFGFYPQDGCHAQNYHSFSGICKNVGKGSGLLIMLPDDLELALTKVRISLHEKI